MERRHDARFVGLTLALLALASFVGSAAAMDLESWDKQIDKASKRFKVLSDFNNAAVLDKETGLVWEQSPATTTETWSDARFTCADKNVGGRKGWRLPSFAELASLLDPNAASAPFLPAGHPFTNVQEALYWSASTDADVSTVAWAVPFGGGNVGTELKANARHVWCVRGGMNADLY